RTGLPHLPHSLCMQVPPGEACVQPKSRTPQVGCTLRSLSHHLALLPPMGGEVATSWLIGVGPDTFERNERQWEEVGRRPLNLLVVPFPYDIDHACFVPGERFFGENHPGRNDPGLERWRFFTMAQNWLGQGASSLTSHALFNFLQALV